MDGYQPIYDAVRSKVGNGDVGAAVERAIRDANLSFYAEQASRAAQEAALLIRDEMARPSVLFRPSLSVDGDQWCALYGADLEIGVAGFGDSPDKAMRDFDARWNAALSKAAAS